MRTPWPILLPLACLSGTVLPRSGERIYAGDLVAELAELATEAEIEAFRAWAVDPDSPFALSLREGDRDHAARLDRPTIYAVRATLRPREITLHQAIVWTNRGTSPVEHLPLTLYPLHGRGTAAVAAGVDGVMVPLDADRDAIVEVELPAPVAPGETLRLRVHAVIEIPWVCRDGEARDRVVTEGGPHCGGGRFHAASGATVLGHWLPTVLPQIEGGFAYSKVPLDGDPATGEPALYHVVLDEIPDDALVATTGVRTADAAPTFVAAAARDFSVVISRHLVPFEAATVDGTTVRVWIDPDSDAAPVLRVAAGAQAFYSDAFGPLPWAEVDLLETSVVEAHGIEFAQVAVFEREIQDDAWRRLIVAHELAHQWWQLEVGNDGVAEPWVDESLTEWSAMAAMAAMDPDAARQVGDGWLVSWRIAAEPLMSSPVRQPADAHPLVFYNAYVRGWLFYDALDEALGRERLLVSLRAWRERAHCRWGTGDELLDVLREADPDAVDDAVERFLDSADGLFMSPTSAEDRPRFVRGSAGVRRPAGSASGERDP